VTASSVWRRLGDAVAHTGPGYQHPDTAAIERVRALHQPHRHAAYPAIPDMCAHCVSLAGCEIPYPCDTIRAIEEQP